MRLQKTSTRQCVWFFDSNAAQSEDGHCQPEELRLAMLRVCA